MSEVVKKDTTDESPAAAKTGSEKNPAPEKVEGSYRDNVTLASASRAGNHTVRAGEDRMRAVFDPDLHFPSLFDIV